MKEEIDLSENIEPLQKDEIKSFNKEIENDGDFLTLENELNAQISPDSLNTKRNENLDKLSERIEALKKSQAELQERINILKAKRGIISSPQQSEPEVLSSPIPEQPAKIPENKISTDEPEIDIKEAEPIAEPQAETKQLSKEENQGKEQVKKVEAIDWRKVDRKQEVMAVGDLYGSEKYLRANLEALKILEVDQSGRWNWKGGDRKIVFHGDILGDRNTQGLDILKRIGELSEQAKEQGGD